MWCHWIAHWIALFVLKTSSVQATIQLPHANRRHRRILYQGTAHAQKKAIPLQL